MCIPNSPKPPSGITLNLLAKGLPSYQCTAKYPEIKMLTPRGEHFNLPRSTGVMFDGRTIFDGIATAKNLVIGY